MATANAKKSANGNNGSKWIRPERRLSIYLRDRFTCLYCLRDLHDADHHESNLCTACRSCNSSRQDQPLSRFAGPETVKHIRRNLKRSLKPYLVLAKAIIAGDTGFEGTFKDL